MYFVRARSVAESWCQFLNWRFLASKIWKHKKKYIYVCFISDKSQKIKTIFFLEWNFIYSLNTYTTYITDVITTFTLTIYLFLLLLILTLFIQFFFLKCLKETTPQKFSIFFLNRLMLFDLKEIYFSVWHLFNKILSNWL